MTVQQITDTHNDRVDELRVAVDRLEVMTDGWAQDVYQWEQAERAALVASTGDARKAHGELMGAHGDRLSHLQDVLDAVRTLGHMIRRGPA